MSLRIEHDPAANAVCVGLRDEPYASGRDLDDVWRVNLGPDEQPIGIELLFASHGVEVTGLPQEEAVVRLLEEHGFRVLASGRPR